MFEFADNHRATPIIKVIGVGGGGCNAVKRMLGSNMPEVQFYAANTDMQSLAAFDLNQTVALGAELTKGLGAGSNPEVGADAAIESKEQIREIIEGAQMLFIAAGMGGGTGTGAAPIIAEVAKEMGILTVAVVTKPFEHERQKRMNVAERGIAELRQHSNSLIVIPNSKLIKEFPKDMRLDEVFTEADNILSDAVKGITDIIVKPGMINVDFADVRTVMAEQGTAMMGTGRATGEERAKLAANMAINSPLLEDVNLANAKGILVNINATRESFKMNELLEAAGIVSELASENANVIEGVVFDENCGDEMQVTVIITGLDSDKYDISQPIPMMSKTFHQPSTTKKSNDNEVSRRNIHTPKFF